MITLTDAAALAVKKIIAEEKEGEMHLRVMVMGGGCAGFEYQLGLESDWDGSDGSELFWEKDVPVLIDPVSLPYITGSEIDYSDGLMGKGFTVNNPNSTGGCGCGKSFTVEEKTLDENDDDNNDACGTCPSKA